MDWILRISGILNLIDWALRKALDWVKKRQKESD